MDPDALRALPLVLALLSAVSAAPVRAADRVVDLPTRAGQTVRLLVDAPAAPVGSVVLIAGGHGNLQIAPDGRIGWGAGNQVVRSRGLWPGLGYAFAVPDIATDLKLADGGTVNGYRWGEAHARDLGAVIAHMRTIASPVVLVGTSRGTLSVANAAARLTGAARPDAVVLTAGLLMDEGRNQQSVQKTVPDFAKTTLPVLLMHHTADACSVTPPTGPDRFRPLLTAAAGVEIRMLSGGAAPRGDPCEAQAAHGFPGLDDQVAREIAGWIARLGR